MDPFDSLRRWIRVRPRTATVEQDVDDELRFHLESRIADQVRQGIDPVLARRIALAEFGSVAGAGRELAGIDRRWTRRRARGFWWSDLGRDLRFAGRTLLRRPGFTAALLLTLGLGIGATAAIFTVVHAALLRAFPYYQPDRLVHLWETYEEGAQVSEASFPDFQDWRVQGQFPALEGYDPTNVTVNRDDGALFLQGARVTAGFFDLLGVRPELGRTFRPGEDRPGGSDVVILTHDYWRRTLGADPGVVERRLVINGRSHEIIGVLPARFHFAPAGDAELWFPVDQGEAVRAQRLNHWLNVIGRLGPGESPDDVRARLDVVMQRLAAAFPESNSGRGVRVIPLRTEIVGPARPVLLSLFGAAGILLLIACVNVASLLLAGALARCREMGVRVALGASRSRLVRQLVTESLVLSLTGAVLGLLLAHAGVRLLVSQAPIGLVDQMAWLRELRPEGEVLLFTILIAVIIGLGLGLVPAGVAWSSVRGVLAGANWASETRGSRLAARDLLVAGQLALTVVLLIGAGLAGRSLLHLVRQDPGFRTEGILTGRVPLSGPRYQPGAAQQVFFEQLLEQTRQLPGVQSAGAITNLPLSGGSTLTYWVEGLPEPPASQRWSVVQRGIAGDYFRVMGIRLVAGRGFTPADDSLAQPAIIINQSLARKHFPDGNALGRRFRFYVIPGSAWEIVGVVGDVKTGRLDEAAPPSIYYSHLQVPVNRMTLVLGTTRDPTSLTADLRRAVGAIDPALPLHDVSTMEQVVTTSPAVVARRFPLLLIGFFAVSALTLALVGVYGVVSYAVTRRSGELAIRAALGATGPQLRRPVVRHGGLLAAAGIGIGTMLAGGLTRFLAGTLYGIPATDPVTYVSVALLLLAVTIAATWIPASRAAAAPPAAALKSE